MDHQDPLEVLERLVLKVQLAVLELLETRGLLVLPDRKDLLVLLAHLDQLDLLEIKDKLVQLALKVFLVSLESLVEQELLVRRDPLG